MSGPNKAELKETPRRLNLPEFAAHHTAAAIDRLVHHSVILELNLPSYKMEAARKKKAARGGDSSTEGN